MPSCPSRTEPLPRTAPTPTDPQPWSSPWASSTRAFPAVRAYFGLGGHHIQFNIVDTATLRDAQKHPEQYRDLMVRVAGYSDYFNDLCADYQEEIIARTENASF